jgi:hypothetical protein
MSRTTDRLHRDLGHIADRSTPSPDAWLAIRTRISDTGHNEMEHVMISDTQAPARTRRGLMWGAAAAVLVLALVAVLVVRNDAKSTTVADVETPFVLTIDGEPFVAEELAYCVINADSSDDPDASRQLGVGVSATTASGIRFGVGFFSESARAGDPEDAKFRGNAVVRRGSDSQTWNAPVEVGEPWSYLTITPERVTGHVVMTNLDGETSDVMIDISCP